MKCNKCNSRKFIYLGINKKGKHEYSCLKCMNVCVYDKKQKV